WAHHSVCRRCSSKKQRPRAASGLALENDPLERSIHAVSDHPTFDASTTEGLPVAPSLGPGLESADVAKHASAIDGRVAVISALSIGLGVVAAFIAQLLTRLIGLITNLAFYGRFSTVFASPADNHLGLMVVIVPVIGAIVVGLMARYGSRAIRG